MVTGAGGASGSAYGYTGEQQDESGMVYLRARYYSVYLNQFIQPDTIVPDPRIPADWNRYAYVRNNPVNYTDPSGHCRKPEDQDQACWDYLRQTEAKYPFIDLQTYLSSTNYWTVPELSMISLELGRLDQASAIDLNQEFATKEVRINRVRASRGNYCATFASQADRWLGDWSIKVYDDYFSNLTCKGGLNHELAHYWDFRDNIANPFKEYVGSSTYFWFFYITCEDESPPIYGGRLNAHEDFAESLSEYVLIYTGFSDSTVGIEQGKKRWKFIEALLDTGNILSPP